MLYGIAGKFSALDTVIIFLNAFLPITLLIIALGIVLWGQRNTFLQRTKFFSLSLITNGLAVYTIRILAGRRRPFEVFDLSNQLLTHSSGWAFPSTHAAFSFMLATFIFSLDNYWGRIAYVLATIVALCRIIGGVHWPSDVLAGAILGTATVFLVRRFLKN